MILHNLHTLDPGKKIINLRVADGLIQFEDSNRDLHPLEQNEPELYLDDAMVFPGLINSHDHLDFNLFPALGNRKYNNYTDWGKDIQRENRTIIKKVLQVPAHLRVQWGIYKNVLNGITTVVNHGKPLKVTADLATVHQECYSLHSVQFEKYWKVMLNNPFNTGKTFVIHLGEGTDTIAEHEIDDLIRWNIFRKKIIAVHGVAMNGHQAKSFKAVIWCPESNYFLFGKTAPVDQLAKATRIIFGTDSTLTGSWNLWEHLRLARREGSVNDDSLIHMLTDTPAHIWGLKNTGKIENGFAADMVVTKMKGPLSPLNSFFDSNPEDILLVLHKGNIIMFDEVLFARFSGSQVQFSKFSRIKINNNVKYVRGDLPALMSEIKKYYPEAIFPVTV